MKRHLSILLLLLSLTINAQSVDTLGIKSHLSAASKLSTEGDYDGAIKQYIEVIALLKDNKSSEVKFTVFAELSKICLIKNDTKTATEYSKMALKTATEANDKRLIAGAHFSLGNLYYQIDNNELALEEYQKALTLYEKDADQKGICETNNNLGLVYEALGDYTKAEAKFSKAYLTAKKIHHELLCAYLEAELIELYTTIGNYDKAETLLTSALNKRAGLDYAVFKKNLLFDAYVLYKKKNDNVSALKYHEAYTVLADSLTTKNNSDVVSELETKFRTNEKQKEIEILNGQSQLQVLELKKRNILIWLFVIIGVCASGFAIVILLSKRKQIKTNKLLHEKNSKIEHQQKEIIDSINYAKRIQESTLGSTERVNLMCNKADILYQPKDIISGDFYWVDKQNDEFLFAVADCTGHGVPGAMMSMIGNNGLNSAVKEHNITDPSLVLEHLSQYVKRNFDNTDNDVKDGMDIAFCKLNLVTKKLKFAGAINSVLICKHTGEFVELKGDKAYIGQQNTSYTTKEIGLEDGDTIYIMSDGFCDQFGGSNNKKFKSSGLKSLITDTHKLSVTAQISAFKDKINSWKGSVEQTDDICVIIVKI